jgi:hypothetical protein
MALVKILLALASVFILCLPAVAAAQSGNTLYGDLKVDEGHVQGIKPETYFLILYNTGGQVIARQVIGNGGRYRFFDVPKGAGLKDKAVAEYEQFLAKKPDYPEKEKIQQFIRENKKP